MGEVIQAKLRDGADPEAVKNRTGILLGEEFRSLNVYNLGPYRMAKLRAEKDVEIKEQPFHELKSSEAEEVIDVKPAPKKNWGEKDEE